MPEVASSRFVQLFQRAVERSGRLGAEDVKKLEAASRDIVGAREQAAAQSILSLLKHDRELDAFEVEPVKKALAVLSGVSAARLPPDLERVLTHAVPAANAGVKEYELTFDFSKTAATFPAKAVLTLDKKAGRETILEVNPDRLTIEKVTAGGREVPFELKAGRLHVKAPGASALEVGYRVKPQDVGPNANDAFGLIRDKYSGRMWTLTWPYNTGALFPSNSNPSDGSTAKVTVKVAAGHEVVATGNPKGDAFVAKGQAPAYAVALYTAPKFEKGAGGTSRSGVEVTGYGLGDAVSKKIRDDYRAAARESLDFYSTWLGKFDYGNTLRLIEVSGGLGGMEHTSAVAIMLNSARDPEYSKETAAHETAHHWFGDNVRIKTWGDFWMSEGFTNYATYRFFRAKEGEQKYLSLLDRAKGEVRDNLRSNPHALSAPSHTDVYEIFDSIPYEMGPWMLRMLEAKLGTEKFDALLKDWFQTHRQQDVSTEDFVRFAKEKTGQDFGAFFKEWNAITQVPSFDGQVSASGHKVTASLATDKPVPSGIELPLKLEGEGGKTKTVLVKPGAPVTIDAGFPVKKWTWDPERTVLADVR